jgi:hypothetical protein
LERKAPENYQFSSVIVPAGIKSEEEQKEFGFDSKLFVVSLFNLAK